MRFFRSIIPQIICVIGLGTFLSLSVWAEMMCIATRKANIREGPGIEYDVSWEDWRNVPLEIIDHSGNWYHVTDYAGDEGYLHGSVLSKRECVIVKTRRANIRSGPGLNYEPEWIVDNGYPFLVSEQEGDWLKVDGTGGVSGWIHKSIVWGL